MSDEPSNALSGLALLCVDLQPVFLRVMIETEILQRRCAFAIRAADGLGLPVIFTEQVPEKLGRTAPELLSLAKAPKVFGKATFSAAGDDVIRDAIVAANTEHVLLAGIETPVCVYQTVLDLLGADIQVTLLSDCIGARRPADAEVCLQTLVRAGAHVLPSEAVFYSLLRHVKHPFFKAYTQLVKEYA
jgi:nicotinamidase-related amidase